MTCTQACAGFLKRVWTMRLMMILSLMVLIVLMMLMLTVMIIVMMEIMLRMMMMMVDSNCHSTLLLCSGPLYGRVQ